MMAKILLDRGCDFCVPDNILIIETEVDFLRYATSEEPLLIRGAELCNWAENFYELRNVPVQVVESAPKTLQRFFPALSLESARELTDKIGRNFLSLEEISAVSVLDVCFPKDSSLWHSKPSLEHSARWLLWWMENTPTEAEAVILRTFASQMQSESEEQPISFLYSATNAQQAKTLLWRWLGADKNKIPDLDEFPIELPPRWVNAIKDSWMSRIIATNGKFFAEMISFPLPVVLRQQLAHLTADYYLKNPHHLKHSDLNLLQPYLDPINLTRLEECLPPPVPSKLPQDENKVLEWFEHQYLPYRRWQVNFGGEAARQIAVKHAQTFARWLLERYPRWLLHGENLAFQKSLHLANPHTLTVCVIFDGLPAWDAEWLLQELSARIPRLTLLQKSYCYTAIPTVTGFAKEALLKGVPPRHTIETSYLGKILPDNQSPSKYLKGVDCGQVWFWRVEQPDKAYHFSPKDKRERQIRAEIHSIVTEIEKFVHEIPDSLRLNVLLTSDHGRLMNPRSIPKLHVEEEMQAHGRAAWGNFNRNFPESGFIIDEQAGFIELFGKRFGTIENLRMAWNETCFRSNQRNEAYPHGGLFPEEVIVPWFVFERDAKEPELEIMVTGKGEADLSGEVSIKIMNTSPLRLVCHKVDFSHGVVLTELNWEIAPLKEFSAKIPLHPWPSKTQASNLTATFLFSQPNGVTFNRQVTAALEVEVLYDRSDDLFKDLNP